MGISDMSTSLGFDMPDPCPKYWELLTETDKSEYCTLRKALSNPACKNRRNRSLETFKEIIEAIKTYVVRNDEGDKRRSLVCGICWINTGIAINTRQLRLILSKSKSSINGSFQSMGYGTIPCGAESAGDLINMFPFLRKDFSELRQWTVRQPINKNAKVTDLVMGIQMQEAAKRQPPVQQELLPKQPEPAAIQSFFSYQKSSVTPAPELPKDIIDRNFDDSSIFEFDDFTLHNNGFSKDDFDLFGPYY